MKRFAVISVLLLTILIPSCGITPIFAPKPVIQPGEALFAEGESLFRNGSLDQALQVLEAYLAQYPQQPRAPEALMRIGEIAAEKGDNAKAERSYNRIIQQYPKSRWVPDAYLSLLYTHYGEGRYAEVIRQGPLVAHKLHTNAHFFVLYRLLGDAYGASGFWAGAFESYSKAYPFGDAHEKNSLRKSFQESLEHLASADMLSLLSRIEQDVPRGYLIYHLGRTYAESDQITKAIKQLRLLLTDYPDHAMTSEARQLLSELQKASRYQRQVIGCLLPLTGRYRAFGQRALMGVELALSQFNKGADRPQISLLFRDTASDPETAIQGIKALADAQVTAIIGPIIPAEEAILAAQEKKIPTVVLNQKQDIASLGDYIFRNFITPEMQADRIISHAVEVLGLRTFAILYPDEVYGTTFMNRIWDAILQYGGKVRGIESYDPSLTDFADPIRKLIGLYHRIPEDLQEYDHRFIHIDEILAPFDPVSTEALKAVYESINRIRPPGFQPPFDLRHIDNEPEEELPPIVNFDGIVIPDASKTAGLIVPQLAFFDIENVYLFGTNLWHSDNLIQIAKDYVQGALLPEGFFAGSRLPHVMEFVRQFEGSYHRVPGFIEAVAYDTARILFSIAENPDIRYRQVFRDEILKLHDFPGVTGRSSCDPSGDIRKELYLLRIKGDGFVEVTP